MKNTINTIALTILAVCFGCATMSTPVMNLPLHEGVGTYDINYKHHAFQDANYYTIDFNLSSNWSWMDYKDVTLCKQIYDREVQFPGSQSKILNVYYVSFYHNQKYDRAPEASMVVDGRQHKLDFRSGRVQTMSRGGKDVTHATTVTYKITSDLLNALKTMKSMSMKIENQTKELDAQAIIRTRSFVADSLKFDYRIFHEKVAGLSK